MKHIFLTSDIGAYKKTNGSHIYVNGDCFKVYGDAYLMKNGCITKLENEKSLNK